VAGHAERRHVIWSTVDFGPKVGACETAFPDMWFMEPHLGKWTQVKSQPRFDPRTDRLYFCYAKGVMPVSE